MTGVTGPLGGNSFRLIAYEGTAKKPAGALQEIRAKIKNGNIDNITDEDFQKLLNDPKTPAEMKELIRQILVNRNSTARDNIYNCLEDHARQDSAGGEFIKCWAGGTAIGLVAGFFTKTMAGTVILMAIGTVVGAGVGAVRAAGMKIDDFVNCTGEVHAAEKEDEKLTKIKNDMKVYKKVINYIDPKASPTIENFLKFMSK